MTTLFTIGRPTLPAEFFDITSEQMLRTPLQQFFHAQLAMTKLRMDLQRMSTAGIMFPGRTWPQGGAPYMNLADLQLDLNFGNEPEPYLDVVTCDNAFADKGNKAHGDTVRFNRPKFATTTYTKASRTIVRGQQISTTPVAVDSEQVPLTIERIAGPLNPENGEVAPYAIERFDVARSVHDLAAIREMYFAKDFWQTVDTISVQLLDQATSANRLWAQGMTSDNSAAAAHDFPFSLDLLFRMNLRLDETDVPFFSNGRRCAVLSPQQCNDFRSDLEFRQLAVFAPPKNPLLSASYYMSIGNIDIFRSNTITKVSNTNSVPIHYAQMFAPGALGIAPGEYPRVEPNVQDNYGENPMAIWIWYVAMGLLDDRFTVRGASC